MTIAQGSALIVAHISRSVWVAWVKWVGCHAFGAPAEHLHPCGDTPKACPPVREPHAFAVILHGRCCFGRSAKAWHPRSPKDVCNDEGSALTLDGRQAEPAGPMRAQAEPGHEAKLVNGNGARTATRLGHRAADRPWAGKAETSASATRRLGRERNWPGNCRRAPPERRRCRAS